MPHRSGFPIVLIPASQLFCVFFILGISFKHFHIVSSAPFPEKKNTKEFLNEADIAATYSDDENTSKTIPGSLKHAIIQSSQTILDGNYRIPLSNRSQNQNRTHNGEESFYNVLSWLPKKKKKKTLPAGKVNLTILPVLAILFFLTALCLKFCTWFRESYREKELESGFVDDYLIIEHGDEEYTDVDLRSDSSTLYDTVSSYTSFIRNGSNYNTWNSIRPVHVVHPIDMQALYKAYLLQRKESISSSRGSVKRSPVLKDVEVQVELIHANEENQNPSDRFSSEERSTKIISDSNSTNFRNDLECSGNNSISLKNNHIFVVGDETSGAPSINIHHCDEGVSNKYQRKPHQFKVSFVTDNSGNVLSSSRPNSPTVSASTETTNHSPSSILSNSTVWSRKSENTTHS